MLSLADDLGIKEVSVSLIKLQPSSLEPAEDRVQQFFWLFRMKPVASRWDGLDVRCRKQRADHGLVFDLHIVRKLAAQKQHGAAIGRLVHDTGDPTNSVHFG